MPEAHLHKDNALQTGLRSPHSTPSSQAGSLCTVTSWADLVRPVFLGHLAGLEGIL